MSRTAAATRRSTSAGRAKRRQPLISPEKGNELVAVLLLCLGVLLTLSLLTYHPSDPSLVHQITGGPPPPTRNWIGSVGAQLAALAFALLGLTSLAVPAFLLVTGWRRFRHRTTSHPIGRGIGALVLLAGLPALLQLTLGEVPWRGGTLDAGGAAGRIAAGALESRFAFPGALLLLLAAVIVGSTLLVQSTLGELLAGWWDRARVLWRKLAEHRRRRQRERGERRVAYGSAARDRERRARVAAGAAPGASAAVEIELPPRVTEKRGSGRFSLRRVPIAEAAAAVVAPVPITEPAPVARPPGRRAAPPPAATSYDAPPPPQSELPFDHRPRRGALPPVNLLQMSDPGAEADPDELVRLGEVIRSRCAEFGVEGTIAGISPGPVITVFEFQPAPGVKVSQIVNLQDDLALALKAESVRIDRLPGRSTLGIEVPNHERQLIRLGSLLAGDGFKKAPSPLTLTLGVTIHGKPCYADLATMPHLLVAGATGAGKSVGLQSMITSILYKTTPEQVRFIFIDPKRIELGVYADIPMLGTPVVVEPQQAANVLGHMVEEMENRYRMLAKVHVRSIAHFNHALRDPEHRRRLSLNEADSEHEGEELEPLPYYVIIIDELADLMMVASSEVETAIARLAQMARAVGIHLIIATQRPSVDVLTGTIKANFPCRISYATATRHDSRTILDQVGSEKLLGKGDMLFMPPGTSRVTRLHGAYISEQETASLVRWLKRQGSPDYDMDLLEPLEGAGRSGGGSDGAADDELFDEAARLVVAERMGSASFLQRRMRIGFSRASRLIDMMERDGLLGPPQGSKPREVLVPADYFHEIDVARVD